MASVIDIEKYKNKNWEVHEFYWGCGIKNSKTNQWTNVILKPDGLEIDLQKRPVILHDNGIEFIKTP